MKLNYEETNELFSLLHPIIPKRSELMNSLGHAINLIDECDIHDESSVIIHCDERVLVTFEFDPCWPDYLIDEVENGDVTIDSAYNDFVTVEM